MNLLFECWRYADFWFVLFQISAAEVLYLGLVGMTEKREHCKGLRALSLMSE